MRATVKEPTPAARPVNVVAASYFPPDSTRARCYLTSRGNGVTRRRSRPRRPRDENDARRAGAAPRATRTAVAASRYKGQSAKGPCSASASHVGAHAPRERAHVLGRVAQLRLPLQALIGVPLKAAGHLAQRAPRQNLGRRDRDLRESSGALAYRLRALREHPAALAAQRAALEQRLRELRGRIGGVADERHAALQQRELRDALGKRTREQHCDRGAARVAEQIEGLPTELIGDVEHVRDVLPEVVRGVRRAPAAETMTGEIERHELGSVEPRREQLEARGVIEPAVQREHGPACRAAPNLGRER